MNVKSRAPRVLLAAVLCAALSLKQHVAQADIVDRVVAVVEDSAIFLSELQKRVRPLEAEIAAQISDEEERNRELRKAYEKLLDQMIDEELVKRAAARANVSVTSEDIDKMIVQVASEKGVTPDVFYAAMEHEGVTRDEFRTVVEKQLLRLKVTRVRLGARVNITDNDVAEEYHRRARMLSDRAPFHAAVIVAKFPATPTAADIVATQRRAEAIAERAKTEDFSDLALAVSDDRSTRESGGDFGWVDPSNAGPRGVPDWIINSLRDLQPGEITHAVRGTDGFFVFKLLERQRIELPPLPDVKNQLFNELFNREMSRQSQIYLRELRRRTLIQVRL